MFITLYHLFKCMHLYLHINIYLTFKLFLFKIYLVKFTHLYFY